MQALFPLVTLLHAPALTDIWVRHNDHYVGVGGEDINERSKARIPDFHALELCLQLATAQLELLHDVADLFKPVDVRVRSSHCVGNDLQNGWKMI